MQVRARWVVVGAVIGGGMVGIAGISVAGGGDGPPPPTASAWVDDGSPDAAGNPIDADLHVADVEVGDVVAVADRLPDGSCASLGALHMRISAPDGMVAPAEVEKTEDCRYVVSKISVQPADQASGSEPDPPEQDHPVGGRTVDATPR